MTWGRENHFDPNLFFIYFSILTPTKFTLCQTVLNYFITFSVERDTLSHTKSVNSLFDDTMSTIHEDAVFYYQLFVTSDNHRVPQQVHMSRDMRFPTTWYVRPVKAQISLRIRTV